MNLIFQGYFHKAIVGLLAMASMLLITVSCNDSGGSTGPTQEDRDSVSAVKESLTLNFDAGESADGLTGGEDGKITLPSTGQDGVSITWTSDKPDIIANDGSITQPKGGDQRVSLTATISKNGAEETRVFVLTVLGDVPIAEILPRSLETYGHFSLKPDDYRTNIALFSAKLPSGEREYRLAIRQADQAAPDADGIRTSTATILRKLSAEPINLFMNFHMDTDLFDTATAWTDESGTSILTDTLLDGARLKADTAYTLYALAEDGGTEVYKLTDFSTDPYPADDAIGNNFFAFGFPPVQYSFVIRNGDPFLYEVVWTKAPATLRFFENSIGLQSTCSNGQDVCTSGSVSAIGALIFINKIDFIDTKSRSTALLKSVATSLQSGSSYAYGVTVSSLLQHNSNFIVE